MAKLPWYFKKVKTERTGNGVYLSFEISKAGQIILGAKALWNLLLTVITKKPHGSWEYKEAQNAR